MMGLKSSVNAGLAQDASDWGMTMNLILYFDSKKISI